MTPAVVEALKTLAASFAGCPLYWPNEVLAPPDPPAPFVWAELTGLASNVLSMATSGSHLIKDDGFVRFHVATPFGSGTGQAYGLAEALATLFRLTTPIAGLQILTPTPAQGGPGSDDGNWFIVSFSVPFWFIYQG